MDAWEKFKKTATHAALTRLVNPHDTILLAVSGGADSICMAHMFWRLAKIMPLKLHIVTFNHNLRKESQKEVKLVENFALKHGIDSIALQLDVKGYAAENGVSIETAARALRYEHLSKIATFLKCSAAATAHNANDNAETALMWLIRGAGAAGLGAIPQTRPLTKKTRLIRPLLNVKRLEVETYVKKNKLAFCTDKSNFDDKFTRNKIRLRLMPEIEKINPNAVEQIFNFTQIQARENAFFELLTDKAFTKCARVYKNKLLLDLPAFFGYNEVLRFRLLKRVLPDKNYALHINEIMLRITQKNTGIYRLSRQWHFKVSGNTGIFIRNDT